MCAVLDLAVPRDHPFRVALGSFVEEYCNKIRVIELNEEKEELELKIETDHPYPATKLMWLPSKSECLCPCRHWDSCPGLVAVMQCSVLKKMDQQWCSCGVWRERLVSLVRADHPPHPSLIRHQTPGLDGDIRRLYAHLASEG